MSQVFPQGSTNVCACGFVRKCVRNVTCMSQTWVTWLAASLFWCCDMATPSPRNYVELICIDKYVVLTRACCRTQSLTSCSGSGVSNDKQLGVTFHRASWVNVRGK